MNNYGKFILRTALTQCYCDCCLGWPEALVRRLNGVEIVYIASNIARKELFNYCSRARIH